MTKTRNISDLLDANGDVKSGALDNVTNAVAPTRHSIRPSLNLYFANSKVLDPRITFTRASNATYYDGYTSVKAEENGIYPSTNLSSSPQSSGVILTHNVSGISAPDGTETASYFVPSASSGLHYSRASGGISSPSLNTPYTGSFFAKANGYDFVVVQLTSGTGSGGSRYAITVDLTNGTIGGYIDTENVSNVSSTATSVGNGWYRISLTASFNTANSSPLAILYVVGAYSDNLSSVNPATTSNATPSFTGDGSSGVYVWGFQIEKRDSLTAYTPTTSSPITKYQPALQTAGNNVARFDHNPVTGESLGLLIEESRTNLLLRSEEFDNAYWVKTNATVTANAIIAPNGTLTAEKLIPDTVASGHHIDKILTGAAHTLSIYAKAGEYSVMTLFFTNHNSYVSFNLLTGTIVETAGTATGRIESVGNGWYRCSVSTTSTTHIQVRVYAINGANFNVNSNVGDGYSGIYIWGAQLEVGAFPTSYIPTVASQVTRSAENASMTGTNFTDWYNNNEGTMYAEYINTQNSLTAFVWSISSSTTNRIFGIQRVGQAGSLSIVTNNSSDVSIISSSGSLNVPLKMATGFVRNDVAHYLSGSLVNTDTSANMPFVNQLNIGFDASIQYRNGTIKKLSYYPLRLTNNELQDLTEE